MIPDDNFSIIYLKNGIKKTRYKSSLLFFILQLLQLLQQRELPLLQALLLQQEPLLQALWSA